MKDEITIDRVLEEMELALGDKAPVPGVMMSWPQLSKRWHEMLKVAQRYDKRMGKQQSEKPKIRGPIRGYGLFSDVVYNLDDLGEVYVGYRPESVLQGHGFFSVEDAEHEAKRRAAEHRVLSRLKGLKGDWEPDWSDPEQEKVYPDFYDHEEQKLQLLMTLVNQTRPNEWHAPPDGSWQQVLGEMYDDVVLALGVV